MEPGGRAAARAPFLPPPLVVPREGRETYAGGEPAELAGGGGGGERSCRRHHHLPPAPPAAQPARLCASCRRTGGGVRERGKGGRAGPAVAAPPRPWLPRQCRRPAPRCPAVSAAGPAAGLGGGGGRLPGRPLRPAGEAGSRGGGCGVGPWAAPPQGGCGASTGRSRRLLGCGTATGTGVGCRVLPLLGTPGRAPRSPASAAAPPADRGGQRRRPCSPRPRSWLGSFSPVKFCVPGEALFRVFSSSF